MLSCELKNTASITVDNDCIVIVCDVRASTADVQSAIAAECCKASESATSRVRADIDLHFYNLSRR